eukprot:5749798-Ditylum_brightwellii.AAC.1
MAEGEGYVQIVGKNQKKVMFAMVYKPCIQANEGDSTVTAQQKQILTMQGDNEAKPRKAFNQDILQEIQK